MANRAYLAAHDRETVSRLVFFAGEEEKEVPYFDSRNSIPLAWFFFFQPGEALDLFNEDWRPCLRFVADRHTACAYFKSKSHLIEKIANTPETPRLLNYLLSTVESWPDGKKLLLFPDEIAQNEEVALPIFQKLLEAIANPASTIDSIKELADHFAWVDFPTPERFEVHLIGYTYG